MLIKNTDAPKCNFCDYSVHERRNQIIAQTDDFYCVPSIGQICEGGHLMIIPKKHVSCLGAMEESSFVEFERFVDRIKKAVTDIYQKPIMFEHGIVGQPTRHAHLQMLPISTSLDECITWDFDKKMQLNSIRELAQIYKSGGQYLFSQNSQGVMHAYTGEQFSQNLRKVVADAVGKSERGDWKTLRANHERAQHDDVLINETVEKLRQALNAQNK